MPHPPTPPRSRRAPSVAALVAVLVATLLATACATSDVPAAADSSAGVVYLVRHAETDDTDPDRPLDATGHARAATLADLLADAGIDRILSSDYPRTRATAAPLAARLGLEVELYDAGRLDALATSLRNTTDTVLVVGHSNTTPDLVVLLGGEDLGPIDETDHERIYRVDLASGETVLRRYRPRDHTDLHDPASDLIGNDGSLPVACGSRHGATW